MTLKEHIGRTSLLAYPVILAQLGHVFVGVADSIMVGQLGAIPLAAVSFANGIFGIVLVTGYGVSISVTPFVAKAHSSREDHELPSWLWHSIILCAVTAFLILGIYFLFEHNIYLLDQPEEVLELGLPYLEIIILSTLPLMFFQSMKQFAEGLSITFEPMLISVFSNILNIFLNYVLIYGKWGFPEMGIIGAGYATLISRVVMAIFMFIMVRYYSRLEEYSANFFRMPFSWSKIKDLLRIGIPTALQYLFEVGAFAFAVFMMGWLGAIPQAAHQIAINLASVTYMVSAGIASATTVRVGNQLGLRDKHNLRQAAFVGMGISAVVMLITGLSFAFGGRFFASLYVHDAEVIALAAQLLFIAALFQLSDGLQVVALGALRGMKDVIYPTLVAFFAYWGIGIPSAYFLGIRYEMGGVGIWIGLALGLTFSAVMLMFRFARKSNRLFSE
jgi:multidrug resistance protein, MATE family